MNLAHYSSGTEPLKICGADSEVISEPGLSECGDARGALNANQY